MISTLAQMRPIQAWTFGEIAIAVVVIAAVIGLVMVACRQFGVAVPSWLVQVLWIVAVAFVCIVAIRIVLAM
jgi:hypothetical protein